MHPPNLQKGPHLATKWAKNGMFVSGLRVMRFKKSTFWVQKVHILGVLHTPQINPGYGPGILLYTSLSQKYHSEPSISPLIFELKQNDN